MKISRLLFICFALVFFTWGATYAQYKATISLPTLDVDPGTRIDIPVTVTTDSSVGIAQFVVEYNSSVLTFVSARLGSGMPGGFSVSNVNDNLPFPPTTPGTDDNVLVQVSGGGSNSFTGSDKEVTVLEFDVIGSGGSSSPLAFDQGATKTYLSTVKLYDINGSDINFVSGSATVFAPNTPPTATNLAITPAAPVTGNDLVGSYDYNDTDGDPEGASEIRWYKNGALQAAYNDVLTVPASATAKGEEWYFTVKPHDGKEFGALATSGTVTIGNTAPEASNLSISPASPLDTDDLVGSYDYSDADGDAESGTDIRWYKNGAVQTAYNDVLTVPASATAAGEEWYFTAKPSDGTDSGEMKTSSTVTVGASNTPPTATNLAISPTAPVTGDDLVGSYDYNDTNGDPEGASEIRWYKNGALQAAYNDVLTIPASATTKGEEWYFTVKPHDGKEFGALATSGTVTIGNTAPVASNLSISPASPMDTDDLVGSYDYSDADGDAESGSDIRWYKNGAVQTAYNDVLTVPASATAAGEEWYFTVKPSDGTDSGEMKTSSTVTIGESPTYTITINIDPVGSGTVTKDPDKESYDPGEEVTLTAASNEGYEFDHWSGDASGTNPVVTITMNSNKNVTAHFELVTGIKKMHIKEIVVTKQTFLKKFVRGKAKVLIVDANDNPVENATVTGEWSRGASDVDTFNTGFDGWGCTYSKWNISNRRLGEPEFTFTVTNVEKNGWVYDSEANVVTWGSTDGKESELATENLNLHELDLKSAKKIAWNNPNPFNPSTTISFMVPQTSHVKVEIYNILGKRIATLLDRQVEAGISSVIWNAKDEYGIDVTSGTYFYKISFDDGEPLIQKIMFLK